MPIDDIDYLLQHSQEENIIMLLDSRKRDKHLFPHPGEFEVLFDEPIHNVCGVEILDTSIPRTMFMTDIHNNSLRVFSELINKTYIEGSEYRSVMNMFNNSEDYIDYILAPQDYQSADDAFLALNDQVIMVMLQVDNFDMKFNDVSTLYERGKSSYPMIRFTSSEAPFAIDARSSTTRNMLGFCTKAYKSADRYWTLDEIRNHESRVCRNLWTYKIPDLLSSAHVFPSSRRTNEKVYVPRSSPLCATKKLRFSDVLTIKYRHRSKLKQRAFLTGVGCEFPAEIIDGFQLKKNEEIEITMSVYASNNFTKLYYLRDIPMDMTESYGNKIVVYPNKISYGLLFEYVEFQHSDLIEYNFQITFHNKLFTEGRRLNLHYTGVVIEYGYFLNTEENRQFSEETYFSRPIIHENNTKMLKETVFEVSPTVDTAHATKIDPNKDVQQLIQGQQHFIGEVPLGSDDLILNNNSVCNSIVAKIPIEIESNKTLIDPVQDIYFIDIYESQELYARVYLNADVEEEDTKSFLVLKYELNEEEIDKQCFSIVSLNKIRLKSKYWNVLTEFEEPFVDLSMQFQLFYQSRLNSISIPKESTFTFGYTSIQYFALQSPGLMNLATESYITLRCEEFENHIRGSFDMRNTSPGLGIVNIDVQGYAVNRLEFFSVKYKQFHPIGTLSKMKLRFERCTDGEMYDFKNVDLHMLASIKFLRPKQLKHFERSVLNPEYNPDFMGYLNRNMEGIEDYSTDNDELDDEYFEGGLRRLEYKDSI